MAAYRRVNWYNEELNKFYSTEKDNNGLIWGVYWLDGEEIADAEWFSTEHEREEAIKGA